MARIYDNKDEELHSLLFKAANDQGANVLIPDLQRPYVWSPRQVVLLIDSLLRGWPFGTLLLWRVHHDDLSTIPSRTFWKVVDRTENDAGTSISPQNPPGEFQMVLDGQQRLQSLLFALAGDGWGFKLYDRDWLDDSLGRARKGKKSKRYWSHASLCLDLDRFLDQYKEVGQKLEHVDFQAVLVWVVVNRANGQSKEAKPASYVNPLHRQWDYPGKYLRLSRLWEAAKPLQQLKEKDFKRFLEPILVEHAVAEPKRDDLLQPLAELLATFRDVKLTKVAYLEVERFNPDLIDIDTYNNAVVNIFTRLNTAGRTLTREEITFAWVKVGWATSIASSSTATESFEHLKLALTSHGLELVLDELMSLVSTLWAVKYNGGDLLGDRDLLSGDKIRPLAEQISAEWTSLRECVTRFCEILADRQIKYQEHYSSLNSLVVLLTWIWVGFSWGERRALSATGRDDFDKQLIKTFCRFCDRWLILSSWSGRYAERTSAVVGTYVRELHGVFNSLKTAVEIAEVDGALVKWMEKACEQLVHDADSYLDALDAPIREQVSQYRITLWLWHRLDGARWQDSQIALRTKNSKDMRIDVDHVLSIKAWEEMRKKDVTPDHATIVLGAAGKTGSFNSDASGDESETAVEGSDPINQLGNCILLEKDFNISKGKEAMRAFLSEVHEFKNDGARISTWARNLSLEEQHIDPESSDIKQLIDCICRRTKAIKDNVREWVYGYIERKDLS
jgi:hypothetical protein